MLYIKIYSQVYIFRICTSSCILLQIKLNTFIFFNSRVLEPTLIKRQFVPPAAYLIARKRIYLYHSILSQIFYSSLLISLSD